MSADNPWLSAHAFYHGDLDRLLLDVAAPLTDGLTGDGAITHHFFLRYWAGGPHLRLRVLPSGEDVRAEVVRRIREHFEDYFARHPAPDRMTPGEYAETARWLAGVEGVPYPAELRPNNSLAFLPYEREHAKYGHGSTIEAFERHSAESSRIALDVLRTGPSADHRSTAGAAMVLLAWFAAADDPAELTGWTRRTPLLAGGRAPEPAGEEQRHRLVELAKLMYVLAGRWPGLGGDGTLLSWARSVGTLRQALEARPAYRGRAVFRVLNSCAHLVCNRLGVGLTEEDALRHHTADAVEQLVRDGV
jgi:hypothetical protein